MAFGLITHRDCLLHETGEQHPESPARLAAISDRLLETGLDKLVRHFEAPLVTKGQLKRVHAKHFIKYIYETSPSEGEVHLDPDTVMNPQTLVAARRSAGAVVRAVDLIMRGDISKAFCNVRPPGHHAERDKAMGFCFFNNIAVGVAHALAKYKFERIAVIDFDVHHGNGTEHIFQDDDRVLFCSSFQHPYYPYTYNETANPGICDIPLAAGDGSDEFRSQVSKIWLPALEKFKPQFVFCSAGFDAHLLDEQSNINLTEDDYTWVTQQLKDTAGRHANGRIISALEGGYHIEALARSAANHIKVLMD